MKIKITYERLCDIEYSGRRLDKSSGPPTYERPYMTAARTVRFTNRNETLDHAKTLVSYLKRYRDGSDNLLTDSESKAIDYFQFLTVAKGIDYDSYGWGDANYIVSAPRVVYTIITEANIQNANECDDDFIRNLEMLRKSLSGLMLEIDKSHNRMALDGDIGAAKAYIESFLVFTNKRNTSAIEHVPLGLVAGLRERIFNIDWSKISSSANNFASAIEKFFKLIP